MMALASVGLFGSGIALGGRSCGITGIFGSCHDKSKTNAENNQKLADFTEALTEDVFKLRNEVNGNFLWLRPNLLQLNLFKKKCLKFRTITGKSLKSASKYFKTKCTSCEIVISYFPLASRSIFNYDTISSLLAITFATIKSYRGAFYTYRINMMNSIQPILNHYLPMSLVPRQSFLTTLRNVAAEQSRSKDRRSSAIPMDEIISFYESRPLRAAFAVNQGIVMRIAFPLASEQTAFAVFRSIAVPMPQLEPDLAIK